jgi:hypothetical protein
MSLEYYWRGDLPLAAIKLLTPRGSLPLTARSSGGVGQIQEKESALCKHAGCGAQATAEILDLALCSY